MWNLLYCELHFNGNCVIMEKWISFALFLLFTNGDQHANAERLIVVPSPESACPGEFTGEPCLTLQQYVANPSLSSDITLELQPGNHQLQTQLSAANINSFTIRATTEASVSCTSEGRFYFEHLQHIDIRDITLDNCRMELQTVESARLVRNYIVNVTEISLWPAVYVASFLGTPTIVIIDQCTFQNNNRLCCGPGGAVGLYKANINIINSNFIGNGVTYISGSYSGGAVYAQQGQVIITNSHFSDNSAGSNGGAVYVADGNITVSNATFTNNTASGGGGAIYSNTRYANISLTNNTFSHNTAAHCGALDVRQFYHPHVNITANTFTHNRAAGTLAGSNGGGVICIRNASIFILDNNFSHNSAAGNGGVLRVDESDVTVERSVFDNNTAGDDGGVFYTYFYPTTYTITHSTFTNNQAGGDGGVMYVGREDSQVTIHQSTFSSNTAADRGGVIAVVGSTLHLHGASVVENSAELGEVVSACNSNVTTTNPEIPETQDLTHPSCFLYGNSTVSLAENNNTAGDTLTTTVSPTEGDTTAEEDTLTTTVSPTEDDTTAEEDTLTTTVFPTEGDTTAEEDTLATTVSPTEDDTTAEEDTLTTTVSPTQDDTTAEGDTLTTTVSPTEDDTTAGVTTTASANKGTAASPTEEETTVQSEERSTSNEDKVSPPVTVRSADAAQDHTRANIAIGLGGAAVVLVVALMLVVVLGFAILVHYVRLKLQSVPPNFTAKV